jgi:MoxR-like ATPase
MSSPRWETPSDVAADLGRTGYLADPGIAQVVFLAEQLRKPILAEGPAGVGKTALALALSAASGRRLVRLQCYEGLDEAKALYEWNYHKQLLRLQRTPVTVPRSTLPSTCSSGGAPHRARRSRMQRAPARRRAAAETEPPGVMGWTTASRG